MEKKSNMDKLSDFLPIERFQHEIVSSTVNEESREDFICELRVNLISSSDFYEWLELFSTKTKTSWILISTNTRENSQFVFSRNYGCRYSDHGKKETGKRNKKCKAKLTIRIKRNNKFTRYRDSHVRNGLCAKISINFTHSHGIYEAEAMQYLKMNSETKEAFLNYFNDGMYPAEAMKYHNKIMSLRDNYNLADASINPAPRVVYYLHKIWRKSQSGDVFKKSDVFENLCEIDSTTMVDTKPPICTLCEKIFISNEELSNHPCNPPEVAIVVCEVMTEIISRCEDLFNLELSELCEKDQKFSESMNDESFPQIEIFPNKFSADKRGKSNKTGKLLKCTECDKTFSNQGHLTNHTKFVHASELTKQCPFCQKIYNSVKFRNEHIRRMHSEDKPFKCDVCDKSFSLRKDFKRHQINHIDKTNFRCDLCQKYFISKDLLESHTKLHENKSLKCDKCPLSFVCDKDLHNHNQFHVREGSFTCEICQKVFSKLKNLKRHLNIHTGDKLYHCKICLAEFSSKHACQRHMEEHEGVQHFECDICHRTYSSRLSFVEHTKVHTRIIQFTECEICHKMIKSRQLLQHTRLHTGEKPFSCDICYKSFRLKPTLTVHLRLHTGERPYECLTCQQKFQTRDAIRKHQRLHSNEKSSPCEI